MITRDDALLIDDMTDEYALSLGQEIEDMTVHLRETGKKCLTVYWILFAVTIVAACIYFIKAKQTAFLQNGSYMTTMVIVFVFIGMFFLVLRKFFNRLVLKISDNYNMRNGNITKRYQEFITIRYIYEDINDDKLSIVGFEEDRLKVRSVVKGRLQTISIPVKYELLNGDKNVIRFLNEHIEIVLNDESKKGLGI